MNLRPLHALNERQPNLFLDCVEDSPISLSNLIGVFQIEEAEHLGSLVAKLDWSVLWWYLRPKGPFGLKCIYQ